MLCCVPKFDIKFLILYEIDKCWSFYIWLWIYYQDTVVNEFTVFATIWMWRIPIELSMYVFGDNKAVLAYNSVRNSVLKKKSSSIACHSVSEQIAYMLGAQLNWVLIWTLLIWIQSLCLEGREACVSKILSIVLHGMISSRGVQYLYYLPRFCWQYFFQGGVDNVIWIRHPTLIEPPL